MVTNEKFWMFDFVWGWKPEEFVRLINASIYEYITLLVGDRTLEKDDVFYYPIKEFLYYADINGFRYEDEQTILTATSISLSLAHLYPEASEPPHPWFLSCLINTILEFDFFQQA